MAQRSIIKILSVVRACVKLWCFGRIPASRVESAGFSGALISGTTFRRFSRLELRIATEQFCSAFILKKESFNVTVYKGTLPSGQPVKIRRAIAGIEGSRFRSCPDNGEQILLHYHPNILNLIGFCSTRKEQFLVYEGVVDASTLSDHLYDHLRPRLSWPERVGIALGVAKGVAHVHENAKGANVHGNVKSSTIVIDDNLRPKVSEVVHSNFKEWTDVDTEETPESMGYLPPEYYSTRTFTEKADVYAFGVVLMELLTGKRSFYRQRGYNNEKVLLVDLMQSLVKKGGWGEARPTLDPAICKHHRPQLLQESEYLLNFSLLCTESDFERRPQMQIVVQVLEGLLQRIRASSCHIQP